MANMKIGKLSKLTGCPIQAIRHYEKEQLIVAGKRSDGNFRLYDKATIDQLLFIKHCRSLDLSLPEIRQLLTLNNLPRAHCDNVNRMMDAHIEQAQARILELTQLSKQLKVLRRSCSNRRTVEQCGILKNLSARPNTQNPTR
tara:strand:- start:2086 stop:2511 length:426 start_codon:yes stop_codon:yes gene_type:complete